MAINLGSPATFTTGVLVGNTLSTPNGSVDSLPTMTKVGGQTVSAALEVQSTSGALLVSRMTETQRDELTADNGMIIYNTSTQNLNFYKNDVWREFGNGDVVGPVSSTANHIAIFADNTGKRLADSNVAITRVPAPSFLAPHLPAPDTPVDTLSGLEVIEFQGFGNINISDGIDQFAILNLVLDGVTGNRTALFTDGSVSVPTTSSALVELGATTGVLLLSRLTTEQIGELSAVDGMLVYATDTNRFLMHQDGAWIVIDDGGPSDGTVTSVGTGTGLTGGPITTTGTISIANTTVTAGSYTNASITVNAQGQLTAASSGATPALANATYILKTADAGLPNAQSLGTLTTGLLKNTVAASTGTLSTAVPGTDYYAPGFPTYLKESAVENLFVGTGAGDSLAGGISNTGVGVNALHFNTVGASNTALGANALAVNVGGAGNTALGSNALAANIGGAGNTAVGSTALAAATVASGNTAVGSAALAANVTAIGNTAVGSLSMTLTTLGAFNSSLGASTLPANLFGSKNVAIGYQSLFFNVGSSSIGTFGSFNVGVGYQSLYSNVDGNYNVAVGAAALQLVSGSGNSALGYNSLSSAINVNNTVAVGFQSLLNLNSGQDNTACGSASLSSLILGNRNSAFGNNSLTTCLSSDNTAVGHNALALLANGNQSVAVGSLALESCQAGSNNVGIGFRCLTSNNASDNTALGSFALENNVNGTRNVAIGFEALKNGNDDANIAIGWRALGGSISQDGTNNVAIGSTSMFANESGANCVAVGTDTLNHNVNANFNTGVGHRALYMNEVGVQNVALGALALFGTNGPGGGASNNIAIGYSALSNTNSGEQNVGIGSNVLITNQTGSGNVSIGYNSTTSGQAINETVSIGFESLRFLDSGQNNTSCGYQALKSLVSGDHNSGFGYRALTACTSSDNTAVGYNALVALTDGNQCVAVGSKVLAACQDGSSNVGVGYNVLTACLSDNNSGVGNNVLSALTTGEQNVGIGSNALSQNVDGDSNVAIGTNAGSTQANYTNCLFLGLGADASANSLTNAIAIGANAVVGASNALVLGNQTQVAIGANQPAYTLHLDNVDNKCSIFMNLSTTEPGAPAGGGVLYVKSQDDTHDLFYKDVSRNINLLKYFAPADATYILQTSNGAMPNSQNLQSLAPGGILKSDSDGVISIAVSGVDYASQASVEAAQAAAEAAQSTADGALVAAGAAAATAASALGVATALTTPKYIVQESDATLVNEQSLGSLSTGLLKNTVTGSTGVLSTAVAGTDYAAAAIQSAKYILQTTNANLANAQSLGALSTGLLKNTVTGADGVLSAATAGVDYYAPGFPTRIIDTESGSSDNLYVGTNAGNTSTTPVGNTAFGINALTAVTTASGCVAVGIRAADALQGGSHIIAIGPDSLGSATNVNDCIAIGDLSQHAGTADSNVSIGSNSLLLNVSGANNLAAGTNAASLRNAYTNCTFLGYGADASTAGLSNACALGSNATVSTSNSIVLGNGCNVGIGTSSPANPLHIVGTYQQKGISAGYTGTDLIKGQTSVQTTSSSDTVILSIPVPTSPNTAIMIDVDVVAMRSTGGGAAYFTSRAAAFYNGSSVISIDSLPSITPLTQGTVTASASWAITAGNLNLRVAGTAGQTVNWVCSYEKIAATTSTS